MEPSCRVTGPDPPAVYFSYPKGVSIDGLYVAQVSCSGTNS